MINYKKIIIIIVLLSGLNFFLFREFNETILSAILNITAFALLAFALLYFFSRKSSSHTSFRKNFIFFWSGLIISSLNAYFFWKQDFFITFTTILIFAFWYTYYLLHFLKTPKVFIINTIIIIGSIHALFFLINTFAPNQLFGFKDAVDSYGLVKVSFPGRTFMYLAYFILLERYLRYNQKKWLLFLVIYIVAFLLMGRRMMLLGIALGSIYLILRTKKLNIKTIFSVILFLAIGLVLINSYFLDILSKMQESTVNQLNYGTDYIRFLSAKYYLSEHSPNLICQVFGNGFPSGRSEYGQTIWNIQEARHLFMADIGILGFFSKIGILGVWALILMFWKFYKANLDTKVFRAFTLFFIPMSCMNVEIVKIDSFLVYAILMYLYDIENNKRT